MYTVYTNLFSDEGTVTTETTIPLDRRVRRITISNDDASGNLSFKFKSSDSFSTLMPKEDISVDIWTREVIIDGSTIPYRIWGLG